MFGITCWHYHSRFRMFLCSNSSTVGLWLNLLPEEVKHLKGIQIGINHSATAEKYRGTNMVSVFLKKSINPILRRVNVAKPMSLPCECCAYLLPVLEALHVPLLRDDVFFMQVFPCRLVAQLYGKGIIPEHFCQQACRKLGEERERLFEKCKNDSANS